jgi:branched-subunit amino acid ABC-type transport system permease component
VARLAVLASLLAVLAALATLLLLALRAALGALALTKGTLTVLLGAARSAARGATTATLFLGISEHFLESLSEIRHFYIIMRDIFYAKR